MPQPGEQYRTWVVDGANVIGSRPDGWWRDRPAAAQRLLGAISTWITRSPSAAGGPGQRERPDRILVVLEGAARAGAVEGTLRSEPRPAPESSHPGGNSPLSTAAGGMAGGNDPAPGGAAHHTREGHDTREGGDTGEGGDTRKGRDAGPPPARRPEEPHPDAGGATRARPRRDGPRPDRSEPGRPAPDTGPPAAGAFAAARTDGGPTAVVVVHAPGAGDDAIVATARASTSPVLAITSDRELAERLRSLGTVVVRGSGWLWRLLDER